jgi:hypothetical protein
MFRHRLGLVALALSALCAAPAAGQTVTATLVGTVRDAGGDALPGAEITVTSLATNLSRRATSDERGDFTVTYLQPGLYSVAAEAAGFKRTVVARVELLVNQTARVDVALQPGAVSESVEVQSTAAVVSTESSSVGQVIDSRQMADLPLKGRGFYDLALLSGAVSPRMPSSFVASRRPTPGGLNAPAFSVAGAREKSNGYLIDGVDAQDPHYLTPSFVPSVDAVQEFKLETNAYSAEFGRYAAQVNATTRSGGNAFHGSLFHFLRNDLFDAANFFDNFAGREKAPLRYNQFGGTIGGPLTLPKKYFGPAGYEGRDRTFFFFNYQGTRTRRGRTAQLSVPTLEQRNGDFSRLNFRGNRPIFDPLTTRPNPSGSGVIRDVFPGNRIPESRITPFAREILKLYPLPTSDAATGNNFFATLSDQSDHDQVLGRLDHRFNERNSVFFRYALFDGVETSKSVIDQGGQSTDVRTHNIAFSYLRTFGAQAVYELRLGYNRPSYLILQDGAFSRDYATLLGLKNLLRDPIGFGVPQVVMSGFSSNIGSDTNPTTQVSNVYQVVNILSLIRGGHSLKTGADLRKINYNDRSERFVRGSFTFTGAMTANPQNRATTGVALADLLLGLPLTAGGSSTSLAGNFNGFSYGFFAQDDWKAHRRLTLNLGLRYELNTRYTDVQNRLTRFDPEFAGGRLLIAGTSKAYIPGRGVVDGVETPRGLIENDTNNFAPRVGLAWRPFAERQLAVRAGYGIFYDIIELQDLRTWVRNPPFGEVVELASDQNANAAGAAALRVGDLFPARGTPAARPNAFTAAENAPDPYFQQWNLNVQQQLPGNALLEVAYVGSKGTHLAQRVNLNQARLDVDPTRPTPILSRRPFPLFGNTIRATEAAANSTYHALVVKGERRFADGFSFLASYTFAKAIDGGSLIDDAPRDIRNTALNKGRASFDLRHRAVLSGTWELPFGPGKRRLSSGALAQIAGGWQVNTIVSLRSGFPFSVGVSGDVCNCGAGGQLAQLVGDPLSGFERSRLRWFNTAAFANPAPGTFGTSGRNILDGPGEATVDFSAFKQFRLAESANLQFRAEFFNLLNRTNFGQPGATVGTPSYGIIQSAGDPRIVQFALKLRF